MDYKSRTKIRDILVQETTPVDSLVIILGWVRTARTGKAVAFLEINDGTCMKNLQAVVSDPSAFPVLERILTGAAVRVKGQLVASAGKGQKFEVAVSELTLVGEADATFPLQKKRHTFEFLREIAHLRPRTNTFGAVKPDSLQDRVRDSQVLSGTRILLCPHADNLRLRLPRERAICSA